MTMYKIARILHVITLIVTVVAVIGCGCALARADALNHEEIDLTDASQEEIEAFVKQAPEISGLKNLKLPRSAAEDPAVPWETILMLEKNNDGIEIEYQFTVHKYRFDINDTVLNLNHIKFDDEGELAVKIAKCMPNLEIIDMDSCGVSDERIDEIRNMFPDIKVVWRVFFGKAYSARTDAERLMISNPSKNNFNDLCDETLHGLYYCHDVKYLDIGHLSNVRDVGYVANMPDLEVLIIAMTAIKNIDAIQNCKNLNYLEFQTSAACDLRPLANLTNLKDLNICYDFALRDIRPLYGLNLDRLWIGSLTPIPRDQIEHYQELHPDCVINTTTINPTEEEWRVLKSGYNGQPAPRYAQLYREMEYGSNPLCYSYNENDRKYAYRFEY